MSQWRELNPWPLPYQGSALPLSYIGSSIKKERETRFELATLSLEGWRSTNWATPAYILLKLIAVGGAGFEPAKVKPADLQSALVGRLSIPPTWADGGTRTPDLLITNQLL